MGYGSWRNLIRVGDRRWSSDVRNRIDWIAPLKKDCRGVYMYSQFQGGWADRIVVRIIYKLPREPRDVC